MSGVNILQKEQAFLWGIFEALRGRIPEFWWEKHKILTILEETINESFGVLRSIFYWLHFNLTIYLKKHNNSIFLECETI